MDNLEQTYQDTLNYLYSFVDYSLTRNFRNLPGQFDLDRMAAFMQALGDPHKRYPVIHVAGTKGKGSVSALCAAALRQAGYRVGLYTSPHLEDYTERIQIDGQPISRAGLIDLVNEVRPILDRGTKLTTFEITTALAFVYFVRQQAGAVIAEVGLGGRLDATNVVSPLVSVITSISYDHMQVLGNTLAEIAAEKAGIIKPGIPVIVAPQLDEGMQAIEKIAAERGAPLVRVDRAYGYRPAEHSLDGQTFAIWPQTGDNGRPTSNPVELRIPLLGEHQVENAAVAYAALQAASTGGLKVETEDIQAGFAAVDWPGRFEVLRRRPALVVDSAHNRDSARKLRQTLQEYFPGKRVILVFGASEDKDIAGMFAELLPITSEVIVTRSFHPRAAEPQALQTEAARYDHTVAIIPEVEDALAEALRRQAEDDVVLVTGSIFVVAAVRQTWREVMNKP
jgi:dihydrofolate synthase/folylpolyglutamate synthase